MSLLLFRTRRNLHSHAEKAPLTTHHNQVTGYGDVSIVTIFHVCNCAITRRKDGAYFYYCAYVLGISRHSGFLWVVLTNTGIFLCGLKLCLESRT